MSTLYQETKRLICARIRKGTHEVDTVLPAVEQLASAAGCGVGTVRRALRELADEGVVRNVRNRGAVVLRQPAVGRLCLLPAHDAHTNLLLLGPLSAALTEAGYDLDLAPPLGGLPEIRRWLTPKLHGAGRPDGLILLNPDPLLAEAPAELAGLVGEFAACVAFSLELEGATAPLPGQWVTIDHLEAARQVAKHLLALGHRRIGVFADYHANKTTCYAQAARYLRDLVEMAGGTAIASHANVDAPRLVHEAGITAYWDLHDYGATNNLLALTRAGLRVPEDFSLVGRNDTPWSRECRPALTTVSWQPETVARVLAEAMTDALNGVHTKPPIKVAPQLIARESSGPLSPNL